MKTAIAFPLAVLAVFVILPLACPSYAPMSDEQLVAQTDLIVVGKITKIVEGGARPKDKSIATITVSEVVKGEKGLKILKGLKTVKLGFPSRNRRMMASTDIFYKNGQQGIWLLRKAKDKDYFLADYPARLQPIKNLDKIKAIVKEEKHKPDVESTLDPWKKDVIDKWMANNGLNRYGDKKGTAYVGGTPLFNEKTGSSIDRYDYIFKEHAEVRELIARKARERRFAKPRSKVPEEVQEKIDRWLSEQGHNRYGDPKGTMYTGGTPLFDEKTGKMTDRYEYVLKKFPNLKKELGVK